MTSRLPQASAHPAPVIKDSRTITIRRKITVFPTLAWGSASSPASSINCHSDAARSLDRPSTEVSILPLEDGKSLESQPSNKDSRIRLGQLTWQAFCSPRHNAPAWFRAAIPGMDSPRALQSNSTRSAFINQRIGVYGNTGRNLLTQPGINNWDLGFIKNFPIWESVLFSLRVESFNTFNHPQYNVNVGGFTASGSGGGSSVDNGFGDAQFGQITQASPGRIIQLGGKLTF